MISVTILTKNSARTLADTLAALREFPEILICDTGSTDATLEIAKRFPNVRLVSLPLEGFGPTHNRVSSLATHDWILSIDSDEIVSPELSAAIRSLTLNPSAVYSLDRHNYFNGKRMKFCAGWHPDPVCRLYHRQKTRFSSDAVHEKVLTHNLAVISLPGPLLHTPYRDVSHLLEKMIHYSTLFAKERAGRKDSSPAKALGRALVAFFKNYILKKGFLGGKEGLILSLHNTLTTYFKYLLLWQENQKLLQEKNSKKGPFPLPQTNVDR